MNFVVGAAMTLASIPAATAAPATLTPIDPAMPDSTHEPIDKSSRRIGI